MAKFKIRRIWTTTAYLSYVFTLVFCLMDLCYQALFRCHGWITKLLSLSILRLHSALDIAWESLRVTAYIEDDYLWDDGNEKHQSIHLTFLHFTEIIQLDKQEK